MVKKRSVGRAPYERPQSRDAFSVLTKFVDAVCVEYASDPTKPSVVLSRVGSGPEYYVSVTRYTDKFANGKVVVCHVRGFTLEMAIRSAASEWLGRTKAKETLHEYLGLEWTEEQ